MEQPLSQPGFTSLFAGNLERRTSNLKRGTSTPSSLTS
jgi:hypothetical protein